MHISSSFFVVCIRIARIDKIFQDEGPRSRVEGTLDARRGTGPRPTCRGEAFFLTVARGPVPREPFIV